MVRLAESRQVLWWSVALAITAGSLLSRSAVVAGDPLWVDELHSRWVLEGDDGTLLQRAAAGNQTPLYFGLARLLTAAGLDVGLSLRTVSLVAGAGLMLLIGGALFRRTGSLAAGWCGMLVCGLLSTQTFYATEARPYLLACLVGTWHLLWFHDYWIGRNCRGKCAAKVDLSPPVDSGRLGERVGSSGGQDSRFWKAVGVLAGLMAPVVLLAIHPTGVLLLVAEGVVWLWITLRTAPSADSGAGAGWVSRARPVAGPVLCLGLPALLLLLVFPWLGVADSSRHLWSLISDPVGLLWEWGRWLSLPAVLFCLAFCLGANSQSQRDSVAARLPAGRRGGEWAIADHSVPGNSAPLATWLLGVTATALLLAVVCTWAGWFPIAMPRYLMTLGGVPALLTGLAVARIAFLPIRGFAIVVASVWLLALPLPSHWSSGWKHSSTLAGIRWSGGRPVLPAFRNEDWEGAWRAVFGRSSDSAQGLFPVFLFPNLLEDQLLDPDRSEPVRLGSGLTLEEYLRFPLVSLSPGLREQVVVRRTLVGPRWSLDDARQMLRAGGVRIICRGMPSLMDDLQVELGQCLQLAARESGQQFGGLQSTGTWSGFGDLQVREFRW